MLVMWAAQYIAAATAGSAIGTALGAALTAYQYYGYAQMAVGAIRAIEGGGTAMANFAGGMAKGYAKSMLFNGAMKGLSQLAGGQRPANSPDAPQEVNNTQGSASADGHNGISRAGENEVTGKPAPPLVKAAGGNTQSVEAELAKLPTKMLEKLGSEGVSIVVVKDSVTEYFTDLIGVTPRGWPEGMTWDTVPGLYDPATKTVVVATSGKFGTGSFSLLLHEVGHAFDHVMSSLSSSSNFRAARAADIGALDRYQLQMGKAGLEETFAESFANFYGGNQSYKNTNPNLHNYWGGMKF